MFIITCFAGDYILASVQDNDKEVIIKVTSKKFSDISSHAGICISLPYYSSAKGGKLELKVIVYTRTYMIIGNGLSDWVTTTDRVTVFSPPEEGGQYWKNVRRSLIPKSSKLHTDVEVDNLKL